MVRDELRQPLKRRSLFARLWAKRPSLIVTTYALTACVIVAAGSWAVTTPHPFAGEPVVVSIIPPVEDVVTSSTSVPESSQPTDAPQANVTEVPPLESAGAPETEDQIAAAADEPQFASDDESQDAPDQAQGSGKKKRRMAVIEPAVEQDVYQQEAGLVVSPRRALTAAPVANLIEKTPLGQLPKIGSNGKKPATVYARPTSMNVIHSDSPKIAIVLGGMGLNVRLTAKAVQELPADVTLAFAPYGENLQSQVDAARKEGHEVLLQVPFEPIGFPASNPGPRTLTADAGSGENLDSLYWHMSRFSGYVGLVNYMGGKFFSNPDALNPILLEVRKRGLLFVEDGSLPLTATQAVAKSNRTEARKAHTVIDTDPDPKAIIAALELLEQEARNTGIAIGTGSGLEVTIDTLRSWAEEAAERGVIIIPVSAAFKGRLG